MPVIVEKSGVLTTVQDLGRPHLRARGLPGGGAADLIALRTANLLVGNTEDAAAIECALVGPVLRFTKATEVAVTGALVAGVPHCRRVRVPAGGRLTLSRFEAGAYAYVAIAGGIDVPMVLGGRGTDVRLAFGGHYGRPLRAGDSLPIVEVRLPHTPIALRVRPIVSIDLLRPIRIVDGKDAARVPADWLDAAYTVSPHSDRAGLRLIGPPIRADAAGLTASCVVLPGTIQLPGDGQPIVLLADAQTLGGYPQIAHVIAVDLPRIAQRPPGSAVRFERVTLAAAHAAAREQAREFAFLRVGIRETIDRHAAD